jgi:hypothetical protein
MPTRGLLLIASIGAVVLGATGALILFSGAGTAGPGTEADLRSNFSVEAAQAFRGFPVYNTGDRADGIPLRAVLRRNEAAALPHLAAAEPKGFKGLGQTNYVSFVYGSCVPGVNSGCAPPVEVQVWPACLRNLALYDPSVPGTPIPERTLVRGVPAAIFDDGLRLEIHTGRSLIVVFGDSADRVKQVADDLRGVNVASPADAPLPPPVPGAVDGRISC